MRDEVQAEFAAAREHARELLRRMAELARIEPDADEAVAEGQRLLQRLEGLLLAQVAQEAQDQRGIDAQLCLRSLAGAVQAVDDGLASPRRARCASAGRRRSRCASRCRPPRVQVGPGHVVEVLLLQQHAGAGVVDVEEALQVGEGIGAAQVLDARRRECATPLRCASSKISSGSSEPSMWMCSSALGMARSSAGRRSVGDAMDWRVL